MLTKAETNYVLVDHSTIERAALINAAKAAGRHQQAESLADETLWWYTTDWQTAADDRLIIDQEIVSAAQAAQEYGPSIGEEGRIFARVILHEYFGADGSPEELEYEDILALIQQFPWEVRERAGILGWEAYALGLLVEGEEIRTYHGCWFETLEAISHLVDSYPPTNQNPGRTLEQLKLELDFFKLETSAQLEREKLEKRLAGALKAIKRHDK